MSTYITPLPKNSYNFIVNLSEVSALHSVQTCQLKIFFSHNKPEKNSYFEKKNHNPPPPPEKLGGFRPLQNLIIIKFSSIL